MDHQDFNIIDIGNPRLKNPSSKNKLSSKKIIPLSQEQSYQNKIESSEDNFTIPKIPKSISKQIIDARNLKKWTRKDMANKINVQQTIYADIENGKSNYDPQTKQIIQKIQKITGIKINK